MKIVLDKAIMDDDLYNALLKNFVKEAIIKGIDVTGRTRFEDWVITCEVKDPVH